EHAVLIEVGVDRRREVARPGGRARQRAGGRVIACPAGVDRVLAVIGPGGAEARLEHLTERQLVFFVLVAGCQRVAGELRGVLPESLAIEPIVAEDRANIEREVLPVDRVVGLDALRAILRVDRRDEADGLLLERRLVEDRLPRRADAAAWYGETAPAVRAAEQIFGIDVVLIAGVQLVADRAAERQVVGHLALIA